MLDNRTMALAEGYRLIQAAPEVKEYLELRKRSGLTPRTREQAVAALLGSWFACHILHELTGQVVAMGRVLGDGGWYFHVVDMAVLPEHQRRGLGDAVLTALLHHVRDHAPAGAYVSLLADPPGRRLYARHGFTDTAPDSIGMALQLP
jgi:ribosomal protein S18 acetylase RimI-like enzyme